MKILKNIGFGFLIITIIVFILIMPIIVESIIGAERLLGISITTDIPVNEWVMFWGSYLGAIGTVVLGYIALKQNMTLANANKKLDGILESYFDTISRPTFNVGKVAFFKYEYNKDLRKYSEDSIDTMYPVVYKTFENDYKSDKCWFTRLMIPIKAQSDIPLIDYRIDDFKWTIGEKEYHFKSLENEDYCKMPCEGDLNLCNINLVYPSSDNKNEDFRQCGEDIQLYIESTLSRKQSNIMSRIEFDIIVRNQINKERKFKVELELKWETRMQVIIRRYFVKPYDLTYLA